MDTSNTNPPKPRLMPPITQEIIHMVKLRQQAFDQLQMSRGSWQTAVHLTTIETLSRRIDRLREKVEDIWDLTHSKELNSNRNN